jgi:ABC-2 type transport system ATP-binding protein
VIIGRGRLLADTSLEDLTRNGRTLEEAYLSLTAETVDYRSGAAR